MIDVHLLAKASLKNRALIALATICALFFGVVAMQSLRTELAPDIELPQIAVITQYEGASPEVVASDVTDPIERALQAVPDLKETTGTSSQGSSIVMAEFEYGIDVATTEQKVQQALGRVDAALPDTVTTDVVSGSISDFPIIQIAIGIGDEDPAALADRIELDVLPRLDRIEGVRDTSLSGVEGQRVSITPDADDLAQAGLTAADLSEVISAAGQLSPAGTVDDEDSTLSVQLGEQLESVADIEALSVSGDLTVADVAAVELEQDPATSVALVNGEPAVVLAVTKTQSANTVEVSDQVRALFPDLEAVLGEGHDITVVFDQAPFISHSVEALATEGLFGLGMAVLVILVFLLSVRSTIVTAISIPTSLLVTMIGVWASGYTLNVLTLGALTMAIGRVVDDSIVVVENIKRHLSFERDRMRAISNAVKEVAGAITASTVTTIIVFLPVAFVGDIAGELFRPFAITTSIALAASLLVALTIVPVLSYWMLRSTAPAHPSDAVEEAPAAETVAQSAKTDALPRRQRGVRSVFGPGRRRSQQQKAERRAVEAGRAVGVAAAGIATDRRAVGASASAARTDRLDADDSKRDWMRRGYGGVLKATLRHPAITLTSAAVIFVGSLGLTQLMGLSFLGSSGENSVSLSQETELGLSLEAQTDIALATSEAIQGVDGVETVQVTVSSSAGGMQAMMGGGGSSITYSVSADEDADMEQVTQQIRDATADEPGEISLMQGGFASTEIAVDVQSSDPEVLEEAVGAVAAEIEALDGIAQIETNLSEQQPLVEVAVDRQEAASRGLTEGQVVNMVAGLTQPQPVGSIQLDGAQVTMYLSPEDPPATLTELRELDIMTATGPAQLDDIASVEIVQSPSEVSTVNSTRSATVSVTPDGDDIGAVTTAVTDALDAADLPTGSEWSIGGVSQQMTDSLTQLGLAALIAILLVYIVMVATFNSLLQPLLLLISVPFAATGALIMQVLSGIPLGVASMVGVLMLVGIVVTNAIVLVDLVNQYRAKGQSVREAVLSGSERRMRPILMTAAATIFALVPMALGITGQGGFISQPLAIVVIGGLLSSTLLTLIVLPVLYAVVEGARERRAQRRTEHKAQAALQAA